MYDLRALFWLSVKPYLLPLVMVIALVSLLGVWLLGCNSAALTPHVDAAAADLVELPDCPRPVCTGGSGITFCGGADAGDAGGLLCGTNPSVTELCAPRGPDSICKNDVGYLGAVELVPSCAECPR